MSILGPVTPEDKKLAEEFDSITGDLWDEFSIKRKAAAMSLIAEHYKGQSSKAAAKYPHYHKDCSHLDTIDIYQFLALMEVDDPSTCLGHALKKIAAGGKRGAKDTKRDILEAIDSLHRYLEIYYPGYDEEGVKSLPAADSEGADPYSADLPEEGGKTP